MISRKQEAITLIALIITIIVLLILAGVSIVMLTSENGLLNQAKDAKERTKKAEVEEIVDIALGEFYTRENTGEDITLEDFLNEKLEQGEFDNVKNNGDGTYKVEKDGYEVTVRDDQYNPLKLGDYIKYDVTYKDMVTDYNFTADDGWRVIDTGTKNKDGTYSGIKLISTGLPINLHYYFYSIKNLKTDGKTIGNWAGNEEQRANYIKENNSSQDIESYNIYGASGLYYNFEFVKFRPTDGKRVGNQGEYKEINGKTQGEITGKDFIKENIAQDVSILTLKQLNKVKSNLEKENIEAKGLTELNELEDYGYKNNSNNLTYWLASPYEETQDALAYTYRGIGWSNNNVEYLRPVITLKPLTQEELNEII